MAKGEQPPEQRHNNFVMRELKKKDIVYVCENLVTVHVIIGLPLHFKTRFTRSKKNIDRTRLVFL